MELTLDTVHIWTEIQNDHLATISAREINGPT
jgi:hypothetical protein